MRSTLIVSMILACAVAILVVGGIMIWYNGEQPPQTAPAGTPPPETSAPASTPVATTKPGPEPVMPTPPTPGQTTQNDPTPPTPEPPAAPTPGAVDWDEKMAELMTSNLDDQQTCLKILELMPKLPQTNQVEAAEFLAGLMPDEGYAAMTPLLTNSQTSADVLDVLMVDLLDRPNAIQLPLLLDLARNPTHPRREEAKEYLELYLDADHGSDWGAWEAALKKFVAENPE